MPSMRGPREVLARGRGEVRPCSDAFASGRFGVRSPSKYGTSTTPPDPGCGRERELGERVVVDLEQRGDRDQHARGVQRRDQRQEAAGGVGEAGDGAADVGGRLVGHGEDRAAGADRDHHIARAGAEPQRGAGVVAGAGADDDPAGCVVSAGRARAGRPQ